MTASISSKIRMNMHMPQMLTILLAAAAASVYPALRASRVPARELNHEDV